MNHWYRYSAYAWLSAAAVTTVGVAMDLAEVGGAYRPLYGHRLCWFNNRGGLLVLFALPVGVLLAANVVMFALSVRQIRAASKAAQLAVQKTDHTQLLVSHLTPPTGTPTKYCYEQSVCLSVCPLT